ncbi:Beta-hexosaminidase [termite gut metagenome]|uniref:beta-N-acetylhexosaminidase n=1 Tax=termite gut metagenome TaxID=433724 RepID=A0A5J4RI33_9ZZZZ
MKKSFLSTLFFPIVLVSCERAGVNADYNVVPLPQEIIYTDEKPFELDNKTVITYSQENEALERTASFLSDYIKDFTGLQVPVSPDAEGKVIRLESGLQNENRDAYQLRVTQNTILINGASDAGTFYGIQTLRKSIAPDSDNKNILFPAVNITDYPRFGYRGAMLDVGRHIFPVNFIKRYIDILSLHNINYFHWHLADDQGWRIEMKKYPELTEVGSIRKETLIGHLLADIPHKFDGKPYGGFYTQDEIREIVKYAEDRFITIIPEIDMPGHMLAALTVYPELGCTGGPYEVATKWGIFEDVLCAGNEKTYEFLEGVFTEITELFPSKYIHIGGDECPKKRWKDCPKCQTMIRKLGLKADGEYSAETKLQSHVVSRVERTLNERGREIIGWDEILEGGLTPNAIIMSWRGTEGGIAAAKQHHKAIMVPHYNLYFDYNQGKDKSKELFSISEYLPVRKVYGYEPVPSELTGEEAKYIIGPQANLWTEYVETPSHAEYMLLPRMAALSEIQWTLPQHKDYQSFLFRMDNMLGIYKKEGYNYAKHLYDISADINPAENRDGTLLSLFTVGNGQIFYTTDGSTPTKKSTLYTSPINLSSTVTLKAMVFHADTVSDIFEYESKFNKATYKPIELLVTTNPKYTFNGASGLVDGKEGAASYIDGNWVGFSGKRGLEAIVDLGKAEEISSVKTGTLNDTPNWIFAASGIKVFGSEDGANYTFIGEKNIDAPTKNAPIERFPIEINFPLIKTRYVKILLPSTIIPSWHEGKGIPALVFVDEIEIN